MFDNFAQKRAPPKIPPKHHKMGFQPTHRQEKDLFSVFLALFGEDVSEKQQSRNKQKTLPKNDCCFWLKENKRQTSKNKAPQSLGGS